MSKVSAVIVALVLSVGAVGCGSSSSKSATGTPAAASIGGGAAKTVKVDVGTSQKVTVPSKDMRIGLFMNAATNAYQAQVVAGATSAAKAGGDTLKVFNANFDPSTQLNQIQDAIQSKSIDAAMILPVDGQVLCNAGSKLLPAAGIPVVILAQPICGHLTSTGPASWVPGTLSYVGGSNTIGAAQALLNSAATTITGKRTVLLVAGPQLGGQAKTLEAIIPGFNQTHPNFQIKYTIYTDYTTPVALTETQAALKAHPDVNDIISVYSPDMTRGVIDALTAAGENGKIPVADAGGSKYSYEQLANGNLAMTLAYFPFSQGKRGVEALQTAASGKTPARFIDESTFGTQAHPIIITKANYKKYPATY
jgi:ribose transport system substrate-binding protein